MRWAALAVLLSVSCGAPQKPGPAVPPTIAQPDICISDDQGFPPLLCGSHTKDHYLCGVCGINQHCVTTEFLYCVDYKRGCDDPACITPERSKR